MKHTYIKRYIWLVFVLSLTLLLANDFYLKARFNNSITGKLSDLVGLILFPWFWSLVFKSNVKSIYIFTFLFFIFWKTEASTLFINTLNTNTGIGFGRVIDYSDLWTLLVLPISYRFYSITKDQLILFNRPFKCFVSTVCIFSFFATSQPKVYIEPNWDFDKDYVLPFSKKELLTNRMSYQYGQAVDSTVLRFEKIIINSSSSGSYYFTTNANLKEIDSTSCVLTLTELTNYTVVGVSKKKKAELSKDEFLKEFDLVIKNIIDNPTPNGVEYSAYKN